MAARSTNTATRIRLQATRAPERLGGETRPYEYPHLYQVQAGDWRISYAVEQNRLAILVLEVLNADGTVVQDPIRETLTRKMKVKLLDWPDGSPSRDLRPEDLGRKVQIRLLDMADEAASDGAPEAVPPGRIRLSGSKTQSRRPRVTLAELQGTSQHVPDDGDPSAVINGAEGKVTPLDSPTM